MVNTTIARGHHAQTWRTARNFLMFHMVAVRLIKTVHYYFWLGRQYSQVRFPALHTAISLFTVLLPFSPIYSNVLSSYPCYVVFLLYSPQSSYPVFCSYFNQQPAFLQDIIFTILSSVRTPHFTILSFIGTSYFTILQSDIPKSYQYAASDIPSSSCLSNAI